MPTSGLVITAKNEADLPALLAALGSRVEIKRAEPIGARIPLVTETLSQAEDQRLWEWLWRLPGVAAVDVAFIYLDETTTRPTPAGPGGPSSTTNPVGNLRPAGTYS